VCLNALRIKIVILGYNVKNESFVIYRDTPVVYTAKELHARSIKTANKLYTGFGNFNGEIPVGCVNDQTGLVMDVVNTRGIAYACRKRKKYRGKKGKK